MVLNHNFNEYSTVCNTLLEQGYGAVPFFEYTDQINELEEVSHRSSLEIAIGGYAMTFLLFVILEQLYNRKRNKELMMLKMNGADRYSISMTVFIDMILETIIALAVNSIILVMITVFIKVDCCQYIWEMILFMIAALLVNQIINKQRINKLSMERTMRS